MSNAKHCKPVSAGKIRRHAAKAALLAALISQTAHGDAAGKQHFDIPAQSLNQALLMFGRQSQQQLMYGTDIADNLRSRNLQGDYTADEAIRILLGDAPLQAVTTGEGAITLQPRPAELQNNLGPQTMPAVQVVGKAAYDATDPYNPDYRLPNASTATKTDTPIMETPFSVQVVPKQVLEDQQVVRLDQAVRNVAGVNTSSLNQGTTDGFIIRGFQNNITYRDGMLLPTILGGGTTKREMANLERVEVLKGPGSILFGRSEPGGIINMVTKQPLATPYYSLQQQFGSYDFYRTTIDATAPLTNDDTLLYRLNLSYENAGSFRDFVDNERVFIAPVLKWNISERTQATFELEYQHFDETNDPGITNIGTRPANVPINTALHEPLLSKNKGDRVLVGFNWAHEFNDNWKISHRFNYENYNFSTMSLFFGAASNNGDVDRFLNLGPENDSGRYFNSLNLSGKIDTAGAHHQLLLGFDHFIIDDKFVGNCCQSAPSYNIFSPSYLANVPVLDSANSFKGSYTQDWYGLYIQDQIELPYHLHALAGVRYDSAQGSDNILGKVTSDEDYLSPRGGLLWHPMKWLSVYGSYTENFGPSSTLLRSDGLRLPPQTAQQWETGIKTEFFDGRLSSTISYFDLTKQNIRVAGTQAPLFLPRAAGEAESRGIEFELSGEIMPGWNMIAAYAYTPFAKITKDNDSNGGPANTGKRLFLAPEHSGSFWNTYEFQTGSLHGLKFGAGVSGVDQRQGDADNSFQLPGYMTVGLLASYQMKIGKTKLTTQINADNLLDKGYYAGTNSGNFIAIGAPRSFMGSIRLEY
ncbi:TonB-dependent receptor [Methylomonas sp. ZR1]|nr:TonB-dependent receptor [Methylomonas sp. ZR1]